MAEDGKVVYKIDADSDDLDKQLDEINSKIEKSSDKSSKAQKEDFKETANEFKKQSKKMVQENQSSNTNIENDSKSLGSKLKDTFVNAFNSIGEGIKENASNILGPLDDIAENIGISFSSLAKAGAIGGIIAIGGAAVSTATDVETSMKKMQTQIGATDEEMKKYEDTMMNIYKRNYGDSFEDVADAMSKVKQQFKDLDEASLQKITEGALTLRDTFDMDLNETLRGTDQLMTQFGISSDEALDLMAKGAQSGLNYTDELGDNIAEYAGKFSQAGYSAKEYFQLLENGSNGGAYNLDKVNDAINEVTTRLADGTIEENLGQFSKGTQDVFKKWQDGKATQKDVIDSIVNDIKKCTNEQDKLTMSATAFGTMGEDANTQFIESLTSVGDTFNDVDGTMNKAKETAGEGLASSLETLKRNVEALLVPLGELFIPVINAIIQILIALVGTINTVIQTVIGWFTNWQETLASLQELWNTFSAWFSELISSIVAWFSEKWNSLIEWFKTLWNDVTTWFQTKWNDLSTWWNNLIQSIVSWFQSKWKSLGDWFNNLLKSISSFFQSIWNGIKNFFTNIVNGIANFFTSAFRNMFNSAVSAANSFKSSVQGVINGIKSVFNGIISFITGVFTGNWRKAWNGVKSIFSGIVQGLASIFKSPINAIISGINSFIGGLNKIKIPDWVPGVGGLGFSIPKIPRLKVGMDFVPSDFYPAYLDYGEAVLTKEQNAKLRSYGGIEGIDRMINSQYFNSNLNIDYDRLATAMSNVSNPIYLDSKLVGHSITGSVDKNMGIITNRKGRYGI